MQFILTILFHHSRVAKTLQILLMWAFFGLCYKDFEIFIILKNIETPNVTVLKEVKVNHFFMFFCHPAILQEIAVFSMLHYFILILSVTQQPV